MRGLNQKKKKNKKKPAEHIWHDIQLKAICPSVGTLNDFTTDKKVSDSIPGSVMWFLLIENYLMTCTDTVSAFFVLIYGGLCTQPMSEPHKFPLPKDVVSKSPKSRAKERKKLSRSFSDIYFSSNLKKKSRKFECSINKCNHLNYSSSDYRRWQYQILIEASLLKKSTNII